MSKAFVLLFLILACLTPAQAEYWQPDVQYGGIAYEGNVWVKGVMAVEAGFPYDPYSFFVARGRKLAPNEMNRGICLEYIDRTDVSGNHWVTGGHFQIQSYLGEGVSNGGWLKGGKFIVQHLGNGYINSMNGIDISYGTNFYDPNQTGQVGSVSGITVAGQKGPATTIGKGYGLLISATPGTEAYDLYCNTPTAMNYFAGQVGFGVTKPGMRSSAMAQMNSTSQGFLPPRMTTAQRRAIVNPVFGLMVADTNLGKACIYGYYGWEIIQSIPE